jgi:hypothetical protein
MRGRFFVPSLSIGSVGLDHSEGTRVMKKTTAGVAIVVAAVLGLAAGPVSGAGLVGGVIGQAPNDDTDALFLPPNHDTDRNGPDEDGDRNGPDDGGTGNGVI